VEIDKVDDLLDEVSLFLLWGGDGTVASLLKRSIAQGLKEIRVMFLPGGGWNLACKIVGIRTLNNFEKRLNKGLLCLDPVMKIRPLTNGSLFIGVGDEVFSWIDSLHSSRNFSKPFPLDELLILMGNSSLNIGSSLVKIYAKHLFSEFEIPEHFCFRNSSYVLVPGSLIHSSFSDFVVAVGLDGHTGIMASRKVSGSHLWLLDGDPGIENAEWPIAISNMRILCY
jgi:hypothetical protein